MNRIDRILELDVIDEDATEKEQEDLKNYFEEYWHTADLFEVKAWFDNTITGALTSSKYYFGYIDEYPEKDGVVMSFAVTEYSYMAHWLLSFGDKIKIIKSLELSKIMKDEVRKLAGIYLDHE